MPKWNQYSTWPVSGEIDIMESRGNRHLVNTSTGVNIGVQQVGSSLHWGPHPFYNRYPYAHYEKESLKGYNVEFHNYQLEWTSNYIKFSIDDVMTGIAVPPEGGFWELGELNKTGLDNPYKRASKMAPFDQEFYIIFNTAVGGQNGYFPDKKEATNSPRDKPWSNNAGDATTAFWKGREQWLPTWNIGTDDSHLQIDYVKVWAI
ncbi:unnamed protein product [Psylliodes chrysocephalus]|uniref:GH16 domain-containing protein n=1 Tax=Psylliodes chrysocephalus TaxID=3402493 RepID=A0A9P0CSZ7_9CUCU|nr:unnamed protein product [Psylliodes chrysocephala]